MAIYPSKKARLLRRYQFEIECDNVIVFFSSRISKGLPMTKSLKSWSLTILQIYITRKIMYCLMNRTNTILYRWVSFVTDDICLLLVYCCTWLVLLVAIARIFVLEKLSSHAKTYYLIKLVDTYASLLTNNVFLNKSITYVEVNIFWRHVCVILLKINIGR